QIARETSQKNKGADPPKGFAGTDKLDQQPSIPTDRQSAPFTSRTEDPVNRTGIREKDDNDEILNGTSSEKREKAVRDISFSNIGRNGNVQGEGERGVGSVDFKNIAGPEARERKKGLWDKLVG